MYTYVYRDRWRAGLQAIYLAADWLVGLHPNPLWRAGAHANLCLACARGVGLRLSTPLVAVDVQELLKLVF
jgi:hypothetical protein